MNEGRMLPLKHCCGKSIVVELLAAISLFAVLLLPSCSVAVSSPDAPGAKEGHFRLHKFEQPIGEESYQISPDGKSFVLKSNFEFTDRSNKVPLVATLRIAEDLTPESFDIKGKTSRSSAIDDSVQVKGGRIEIRQSDEKRTESAPDRFFTIAGYAPTAIQMELFRYWLAHGSPAKMKTYPTGEVRIERRGSDTVSLGDKKVALDRYSVAGLIWGRETAWLDANHNLVTVVTVDAEFDHFEALRDGFETALTQLVSIAGRDEMAELAQLGANLPGRRTGAIALVGATLVDGTGQPAVPDAAVVINQGKVVAVGPRSKVQIPKNATVIDATGKTILPGLWDMHAHFEQVEWGPIYLAAGATTVRDVGNELEFITAVRDAIRDGKGLGPRIVMAGVVDGDGPAALGVERVNNTDQAKHWVDRYHQASFQQMKIYSSMKQPNVAAVCVEAHQLGMTVTGHVPIGMDTYDAVNSGMDQINHVSFILHSMLDDSKEMAPGAGGFKKRLEEYKGFEMNGPGTVKLVQFLKQHGTVVDPTLALMELGSSTIADVEPGVKKVAPELAEQFAGGGPPADIAPDLKRIFQLELQTVGALHRAGVPIVAGTDQAVPGHSLHREIELYVQAGFTPMEAIQAATIVPARVMKLDKELGTVEVGKRADLIVLGGNPLESISNIRKVERVVTGGVMYDTAPLWESVGFQP
jgi:imidazolonepropionase-like amidohydrolase